MDDELPISILDDLIRIASQNPMGHRRVGPGWSEKGLSEWLCRFFAGHNVLHRYDEIEQDRGNVVAWLPGDPDRPTILLDAHQDTVPVDGMTIDPFTPLRTDGRVYGRGACDVKGSMAAILAAVVRLKQTDPSGRANLIVSLTCDEELNQIGARELVKRFGGPEPPFAKLPDAAVISEPTELDVVIAHKGVVRWTIETAGVAVHSSKPERGENAIYSMAAVVRSLRQLADEMNTDHNAHALCGPPTMSVGTISGGQSVNIVPERCVIEIDRRVVPGESIDSILEHTQQYLSRSTDARFSMNSPYTVCPPLSDGANGPLARQLIRIATPVCGRSETIGVPFATHAPQFSRAGIPTVVFGPGSIDQAHTKDEWIEVEQLNQGAEILFRLIAESRSPIG